MTTAPTDVVATSAAPGAAPRKVHPGLALAVLAGAQLMIVLDATIVNIALPDIKKALDFSDASLTWVMNAYTLTFGGLLLLGGRLGDLLGRRRMFIGGLLLFTLASLLGGFAQNDVMLLAARALQGVGGAVTAPAVLSLVTTTFQEGAERNRALGVYAAVSGMGAAVGLLAGGVLTEYATWRWVMFVNVPIGVLLATAIPRVFPNDRPEGTGSGLARFDIPGAITSTVGVSALVYGFIRVAEQSQHNKDHTWADPTAMAFFAIGLLSLAAFIAIELRTKQPLLPLRLFLNRTRTGGYLVMMLAGAGMMSTFFFLTLYMQNKLLLDLSPVMAGTAYLPLTAGVITSAQITSRLITTRGPRPFLMFGPLLAGTGLLWLSFLKTDSDYVTGILPGVIMMGLGMGAVFVSIMSTATAGIDPKDAGVGSAVLNVTQQIGGTIGLAVLATISTSAATSEATSQMEKSGGQLTPDGLAHVLTSQWTAPIFAASLMLFASAVIAFILVRIRKEDVVVDPSAVTH
ncbi:MFS transporter [Yinghuangia seranimata]|uniref:MFS transporter n=1 Tax=Yinghuangia seranimata TaxID=408067 RepID=UPI00248AC68B|nr:MFS transporter [Yinghuangia seranimata]MDI2126070.1 MFS transporter [Yinghuangia seranimata]